MRRENRVKARNRINDKSAAAEEAMRLATRLSQKADHVIQFGVHLAEEEASRKINHADQASCFISRSHFVVLIVNVICPIKLQNTLEIC